MLVLLLSLILLRPGSQNSMAIAELKSPSSVFLSVIAGIAFPT